MKHNRWFAVGAILVTLFVPITIQYLWVEPRTALTDKVTLEKYEQLDTGMTYEQVAKIIGTRGKKLPVSNHKELTRDGLTGNQLFVTYRWKNPNGSGMTATFQQGRMTLKHQARLK